MASDCETCGQPISGKRRDARFCSARCLGIARVAKNLADGVCVAARSHGPSVNGRYCAACVEKLKIHNRKYEHRRSPSSVCDRHIEQQRADGYGKIKTVKSCLDCQAKRVAAGGHVYIPLEATLASPQVRILQRLNRDEWVSAMDLLDSLGVCEPIVGTDYRTKKTRYVDRNRYSASLARLFKEQSVERRAPVRIRGLMIDNWNEYRITDLGRQRLRAMLHYDTTAATDEEADLDAVIAVFGSLDVPELEAA